ncbi:hypothetical protein [Rhodopseudomonas parapalustris]
MKKILPLIISILMIGMTGCAKKVDSSTSDKTIENKYAFAAADNSTGEVTEPTPEPTIIPSTEPTATPEPTPTPTATPKPTPEPTKAPNPTSKPQRTVYDMFDIDKNRIIKDSSKYRVKIGNLSPQVNSDVKITIECDTPMNVYSKVAQVYADSSVSFKVKNLSDDHKSYNDTFPTQNWATFGGNEVKGYVFIEDYTDKNIYEYDFTLTLQK